MNVDIIEKSDLEHGGLTVEILILTNLKTETGMGHATTVNHTIVYKSCPELELMNVWDLTSLPAILSVFTHQTSADAPICL